MHLSSGIQFPSGIITAAVTPMDAMLQPDARRLVAHCQSLLAQGSDGIVLLGTTGEANSLSIDERMQLVESVVDEGISPALLMVGTGCCAITDTVQLTRHAIDCGARSILMLPPFYYKPVSDDALLKYFSDVIDRVNTAFHLYLYHFPQLTGLDLSVDLIRKLMTRFPDIVQGIKDSGGNLSHMLLLRNELPALRLYSGTEAYLLDILQSGGAGCISATANITCAHAAAVVQSFRNGTNATALQQTLSSLRNVFDGHGFVGAIKGYLALASGDTAWLHVRPPNTIPGEEVITSLIARYAQMSESDR